MTSLSPASRRLVARCGVGAALVAALTFVVFTVCFVALLSAQPLFTWTTLADYVRYHQRYPSPLPDLARLLLLCFGIAYLVLLNAIYDYAGAERKLWARISLCFGLFFAVLTSAHYFVQLSTVRLSLADGNGAGLEQVVQANPYSAFAALNMLGWSLGLGLSSLFAAPIFTGRGLARVIRVAFVLNGICCLLGGIGYVLKWIVVVFLALNVGMGGAVLVLTIALGVLFKRTC